MSEENKEGKVLVFSPAGFVLKLIFSVSLTALTVSSLKNNPDSMVNESVFRMILLCVTYFVVLWFGASMFGFCLRATGNYIIAAILMVILLALLCAGVTWLGNKNEIIGNIVGIAFILFLIWLPVNDVRKAVLYFKNTV